MNTRQSDLWRLAALLPLVLVAVLGRSSLRLDVENLAMKSVGTETADVAELKAKEFGRDPQLLLLARPRAPEFLNDSDLKELREWRSVLEERIEVAEVEQAESDLPVELRLALHVRTDAEGRYGESVQSLDAFARRSVPPTFALAITGFPALEVAIATELGAERSRILPIIVGSLAVVLLLIYRNVVLVLGALSAPLLGVLFLEGMQGLLSIAVDPISALLGPAVLTVGVASSVHVLERYLRNLRKGASVQVASHSAVRDMRLPFALTALTTIAGFLGLLASPIPAVQQFGWLASLGVLLAIGLTFFALPSVLSLFHRPIHLESEAGVRSCVWYSNWVARHARLVVVGCAVAAVLALSSVGRTHIDNDPLHVLSATQSVRRDTEEVSRRLGGSAIFELLLPPQQRAVAPLEIASLVARVGALDGIVGPAGKPKMSDNGYLLVPFLMKTCSSDRHERVFAAAEGLVHELGWKGAAVTGLAVQIARDSYALVRGQREGILATVLGLWLVMAIGFRSWSMALLGLIPNVLPVILINGMLGAMNRPLSVASSMIGTVMLGLVVDDTIHFLHAYRRTHGPVLRRMTRTLHEVRRPIVITTVVLCVGFSATLFGKLHPTLEFGFLAVATLVIAILADLVLLPALLMIWSWRRSPQIRSAELRGAMHS